MGVGGWSRKLSREGLLLLESAHCQGSLLFWICIFNIRMFAEVGDFLRDRKCCGAQQSVGRFLRS